MQKKQMLINIFFVVGAIASIASAMGVSYSPPGIEGFHPLYDDVKIISPLQEASPSFVEVSSSLFKDTTIVDFEKRSVTFVRYDKHLGVPIWTFHYPEMNEYLNGMFRFSVASSWKKSKDYKKKEKKKSEKNQKLEFALPVHYPAWARRILGKEPPKLSIKGYQSIILGYDAVKETVDGDEQKDNNSGGLDFNWGSQFVIKGSIGRLVSVELKMSKDENDEGGMSIENQEDFLKIQYKADPDSADQLEDEIIQEITAGQTNFEMPGQGLAGFSGSHEGLWGIKIKSQWGPLSLTTIVSQEKSEKKERKIYPNKTSTKPNVLNEIQYAEYRRYFLDNTYRDLYLNDNVKTAPAVKKLRVYKQVNNPDSYKANGATFVWARYGLNEDSVENYFTLFEELSKDKDYVLNKTKGYITFPRDFLDKNDRVAIYLEMDDGTKKGAEPDLNATYTEKGKTGAVSEFLWLLKSDGSVTKSPASDPNYMLMWRNVYSLPGNATPAGFNVTVERKADGGGENVDNYNGSLFSKILQLTDNEGKENLSNTDIYDFSNSLLTIPPYALSNGLKSDWVFANPALGNYLGNSNANELIYYDSAKGNISPIFIIGTSGSVSTKSTTFNVAFGILEGTEELWLDGNKLARDVDYQIDYDFGSITLISNNALLAEEILVKYQQQSIFSFDSRQFLGAYGRLDFPNIGTNSFLATSFMGQFTSANSNIPKVGLENYNRFLMDYNLHLEFEPEWMTNLVNYIPLVSTTSTSSATIDLEVAYSSLKSDDDNHDQAYIEDFKTVQADNAVSTSYTNWYPASPSPEWRDDNDKYPRSWYTYWISPDKDDKEKKEYQKINKEELFKRTESEENSGDPVYLNTLRLVSQGVPENEILRAGITDSTAPEGYQYLVEPWTGIMKPEYSRDKTEEKYFEFWIRTPEKKGVVYLDLGQVSEGLSINGFAVDDTMFDGLTVEAADQIKISKGYDLGLDNLPDTSEVYYYPNFTLSQPDTGWHLKKGDPLLGDFANDPARDNWAIYDYKHLKNRDKATGKQGDLGRYTTEDVNGDGFQSVGNFYRISLDLSDIQSSPFYDKEKSEAPGKLDDDERPKYYVDGRWSFIRIPINSDVDTSGIEQIGSPSWNDIRYVRILWSGFETDTDKENLHYIDFHDMKFAKNKWKEVVNEDVDSAKIDATVLTTEVDAGYYNPPRAKKKYLVDPNDKKNIETDYALKLNYYDVKEGEEVLVEKSLLDYQKIDLSDYKEVRLWTKEQVAEIKTKNVDNLLLLDSSLAYIPSSSNIGNHWELVDQGSVDRVDYVEFVFRFGNNDSSYYEFSCPFGEPTSINSMFYSRKVRERFWNSEEGLSFDIKEFLSLKESYIQDHGFILESIDTSKSFDDGRRFKVFSTTGVLPNIANITWMAFGVKRNEDAVGTASGEIWLNGLRIFGIRDVKGWAFRAKLDTKWADFLSASASLNYDEADFRQMSENARDDKNSSVSSDINSQVHLDKFMPPRWGIKIPVSAHIGASLSRPRLAKGSDISLTDEDGEADHFGDMIGDFADLIFKSDISTKNTPAEHYETNRVNRSWRTGFSKDSKSKTALGRLTLDRMSLSYGYSEDSSTTKEGLISVDEVEEIVPDTLGPDHVDIKSSSKHTSTFKYDLSPKKNLKWTSWKPFKKYRKLPRHLKKFQLNLLPKTLSFDVVEADYSKSYSYRSINDVLSDVPVDKSTENLTMNHRMRASYAPFDPLLKSTYNLSISRNFDNSFSEWDDHGDGFSFVREKIFEREDGWERYYILKDESSRNQNVSFDMAPQFFSWLTHSVGYTANYSHNPIVGDTIDTRLNTSLTSDFNFKTDLRLNNLFSTLTDKTKKREKLNSVLSKIEDGFSALNITFLRFSYNGKLQLTNNNISTELLDRYDVDHPDFMLYQLGFEDRGLRDIIRGTMNDESAFGGVRSHAGEDPTLYENDLRVSSQNHKLSTKINLPKPLLLNFDNISIGWKRSYTVKPAIDYMKETRTKPDFNIRMSSKILEQIPAVRSSMKNLTLTSSYNYSKDIISDAKDADDFGNILTIQKNVNRKHAFRPLFKVDGVLKKKPINLKYEFGFSRDSSDFPLIDVNDSIINGETMQFSSQKEFSNKWSVGYAAKRRKKEKTILLFKRWNMKLTGELKFDMVVDYNKVYRNDDQIAALAEQDTTKSGSDYEEEDKGDYNFSLNPKLTYNFTKNIEGSLMYKFTKSRNSQYVEDTEITHNIFQLTLKIYFK